MDDESFILNKESSSHTSILLATSEAVAHPQKVAKTAFQLKKLCMTLYSHTNATYTYSIIQN